MPKSLFVSGATAEQHTRARMILPVLAREGIPVTWDWTTALSEEPCASCRQPRGQHDAKTDHVFANLQSGDLTAVERVESAVTGVRAVLDADVVWILVPGSNNGLRGGALMQRAMVESAPWVHLGVALGVRHTRVLDTTGRSGTPRIILSGFYVDETGVYGSLADGKYVSDDAALDEIVRICK